MRARPHYLRVLSQKWGRAPIIWGRAPIIWGCSPQPTCTFPPLQTFPHLPACNISWSTPPIPRSEGTTYPSTPSDMKSSIAASWPQDGLLTTSQAVTMNPRSQWSLFEFGKRLNCEEICIQKFSLYLATHLPQLSHPSPSLSHPSQFGHLQISSKVTKKNFFPSLKNLNFSAHT